MDPQTNSPVPPLGPNQPPAPVPPQPSSTPHVAMPAPISPVPVPQQSATKQSSSSETLGLVSIILIIFPLAGIVVGYIGRKNAKRDGASTTIPTIGLAVNIIVLVLISIISLLNINTILNTLNRQSSGNASVKVENNSALTQNKPALEDAGQASAPVVAKCLNLKDFPTTDTTTFYKVTAFFKADSTTYAFSDELTNKELMPLVNAYNKYKDLRFDIVVTGRVRLGGNTSASRELANSRAQKVLDFLASKGIPKERMRLADPEDSTNSSYDPADSIHRSVVAQMTLCEYNDPNYDASF